MTISKQCQLIQLIPSPTGPNLPLKHRVVRIGKKGGRGHKIQVAPYMFDESSHNTAPKGRLGVPSSVSPKKTRWHYLVVTTHTGTWELEVVRRAWPNVFLKYIYCKTLRIQRMKGPKNKTWHHQKVLAETEEPYDQQR